MTVDVPEAQGDYQVEADIVWEGASRGSRTRASRRLVSD